MDGGFFEPFGSGLKENFSEDIFIAGNDEFNEVNETNISEVVNETTEDTPSPYTELLSTSLRLNIKELYEEVLQEILHDVGGDKVCLDQKNIIAFAQKAFNIDQETHDAIHKSIKNQEATKIVLNIEIIEGKNMEPKDPNGLSNPFCTLFLSSRPQHKYVTSIKRQTIQPVWKEYFSLSVENPATDVLHVEVWDFTPEETDKEKGAKTGETKGLKGFKKFIKEIPAFSKQDKCMIGNMLIPLKTISSRGQKDWYNLEGKKKRHGSLMVKMSFGKEKDKHVSTQVYRQLLNVLLDHQISLQNIEMHSWMGDFLPESILLIQQHVGQSNISAVEEYLGQWVEFINVHLQSPVINAKVFSDLLDDLVTSIKAKELSDDELKIFWQSVKTILPLYYNFIKTIRNIPLGDEQLHNQIEYVLNILRQLHLLDIPNHINLFTSDIYDWLSPYKHTRDIRSTLQDAIVQGAVDCHANAVESNEPRYYTEEEEEEDEIKVQLKVINLLKSDLQNAVEYHDGLFIEKMQLPYASILFSVYDKKISEMCEPLIDRVCAKMKPIDIEGNGQFEIDDDPFSVGTSLLELYTEVQNFSKLANNNSSDVDLQTSRTAEYHTWFQLSVTRWLDIAAYKVMRCTERAVELDGLVKVHSSLDYSSSAVDTLAIFYQIKAFWQQLAWPDVEGSYSFMAKIIDDVCKYSLYYSDQMSNKVSRTEIENQTFKVTKEWCLAVNNIDYIKRSIHPFVNGLGLADLMEKMAHCKTDAEVNQCRKTLELVIDDAIDIVNNRINKLLQMVVEKMTPDITKFLTDGVEVPRTDKTHWENLIPLLDESLCTLNNELNDEHFQLILEILVERIFAITFDVVDKNIEKKKPPPYFRSLRNIFRKLFEYLTDGYETEYTCEMIQRLESKLHLHALDTDDLVYEYYSERLKAQKETKETNEGVLTVKLLFINNVLKMDVLNAHCLRSMDYNGFSDPYVKICLVPQHKFQNVMKLKTAVQKKTLSPLFDEIFEIPLTPEQRAEKNAIVMFIIKDQDFMGLRNEFISETFVHFKDIQSAQAEDKFTCSPQIKLNMTVPKSLDSKILEVLDCRTYDKSAKDFIKSVKMKIAVSSPPLKKH